MDYKISLTRCDTIIMFYFMYFLVTPSNDSFDYMAISGGKTSDFD